ncbi:hypothetical protein CA13_49980 [Planctomycetes bacterium CA13]|uniref:General secretion pathway GspH domain-containing protein n=1 Tax=Novipirellula herctigrandis TaxID=2527986 RepID=A0A5C5ZAI2_9BACT|nr:hypothetical protein CA13_49980 [Planctomycetes bacterium CA13]
MYLNPRTNRHGVTLLEAVIVAVLVSGAAVATSFLMNPSWSHRPQVRATTTQIGQVLTMARNMAVKNQTTVIVRRDTTELFVAEMAGPFRDQQERWISIGAECTLSGSPAEIRFSPMANADQTLRWNVSAGGVNGQVEVNPITGVVTTRLP